MIGINTSNKKDSKIMKTKTFFSFLAITFGITWGLATLLMLFYDQMIAIFGELSMTNPLFILLVYSPGFAGPSR